MDKDELDDMEDDIDEDDERMFEMYRWVKLHGYHPKQLDSSLQGMISALSMKIMCLVTAPDPN